MSNPKRTAILALPPTGYREHGRRGGREDVRTIGW